MTSNPFQNVIFEIESYRGYIKHLNSKIQQAPADEAQTYLRTIEEILLEFDQLLHHAEVQKKHAIVVFEEVMTEFEEWLGETVDRLECGEIITIDIEEFQSELTVSCRPVTPLFDDSRIP